jgi:lipoprotein-anchoring transpeptidase ErfK/SrfK
MTAFQQLGLAMGMLAVFRIQTAAQGPAQAAQTAQLNTKIVVSLEDHELALVEDGKVKKIYPVAVGKPATPSPVGTFTIKRRVINPTYSHDGRTIPPGPRNPVGTRWMGLSLPGYGIHGTNEPNSIGKAASHGCIRMAKADLEELYPQVEVGDTVELIGRRDQETREIFGGQFPPVNGSELAAKPVQVSAAPEESAARAALSQAAVQVASGISLPGAF